MPHKETTGVPAGAAERFTLGRSKGDGAASAVAGTRHQLAPSAASAGFPDAGMASGDGSFGKGVATSISGSGTTLPPQLAASGSSAAMSMAMQGEAAAGGGGMTFGGQGGGARSSATGSGSAPLRGEAVRSLASVSTLGGGMAWAATAGSSNGSSGLGAAGSTGGGGGEDRPQKRSRLGDGTNGSGQSTSQ